MSDEFREDWITPKQYAARFGLHIQTVYAAIRNGHQLHGRVVRVASRSIRIVVPRESIENRKSA